MEFKGTKGKLELKFVSNICIGIGTIGDFSQITANTILPETDAGYIKEKLEIESNMLLYSKSPEMLEMLIKLTSTMDYKNIEDAKQLIKEATTLNTNENGI